MSAFGVGWNYAAAAVGTLATLGLLTRLPALEPASEVTENPLRAIGSGLRFVASHRVVGSLMLLGLLFMVAGGIPVLMPAFATLQLGGGPATIGLLYAAPACGAVLGSVTSGWAGRSRAPGRALLVASVCGFALLACSGWRPIPRSPSRSSSGTASSRPSRRSSATASSRRTPPTATSAG